jgi:oligoendopeptidase F
MAIKIKKSHEGLLHKNLGVSKKKKLTMDQIMHALHSQDPDVRKRAQFAKNARSWKH